MGRFPFTPSLAVSLLFFSATYATTNSTTLPTIVQIVGDDCKYEFLFPQLSCFGTIGWLTVDCPQVATTTLDIKMEAKHTHQTLTN